ncbi:DNA cytosine methyltransferase [Kitasatospora xanthocidica]|uniref:DNA cytosine methyltransferase n=1 Tax=Kitasatospora xanthocidica TaxID=83382 RepID=UPI0036E3D010
MGASQRSPQISPPLTSIEICAGAGGQAVGLHHAGFEHYALVELDPHAVASLGRNVREHKWPGWDTRWTTGPEAMNVKDLHDSELLKNLDLAPGQLDLLAGGVPCPPFSLAGKQLGKDDERDLFPEMLRIVSKLMPKAVMIENVRGILDPPEVFIDYRRSIVESLGELGYVVPEIDEEWTAKEQDEAMRSVWRRLDACDFGVPQLRPRAILVAIHEDYVNGNSFTWPKRLLGKRATVADYLKESMQERCSAFSGKNSLGEPARGDELTGETIFEKWYEAAKSAERSPSQGIAPTLVGGSKKHGGADLGPTRAKNAWKTLGVDANGVANDPHECVPDRDLFREDGPMLTVEQAAIIQGFPRTWKFSGGKTARYRQVGNAFPPPVAEAVGRAIAAVLRPELRDKLLAGYEMDTAESVTDAPAEPRQIAAFRYSDVGVATSPRKNRRRDLVGADV